MYFDTNIDIKFYVKMKVLRLNINILLKIKYQIRLEYICICNVKSKVAEPNHFYGKILSMLPAKKGYKLYQKMFHNAYQVQAL